MVEKLLLSPAQTHERYKALSDQHYEYPYVFTIRRAKQLLYYLGVNHFNNDDNRQLPKIHQLWRDYLRGTGKENGLVVVEGSKPPVEQDEKRALTKYGTSGLMVLLAERERIACISLEPDIMFELRELEKQFSRDDIMYYYFARRVEQWARGVEHPDFSDYMGAMLNRFGRVTNWDYDFSLGHMVELHDKRHNHPFDPEARNCFYQDATPYTDAVAAADSRIRNIYVCSELVKFWIEKRNLFVVYGSGHAITQEAALKKLLN